MTPKLRLLVRGGGRVHGMLVWWCVEVNTNVIKFGVHVIWVCWCVCSGTFSCVHVCSDGRLCVVCVSTRVYMRSSRVTPETETDKKTERRHGKRRRQKREQTEKEMSGTQTHTIIAETRYITAKKTQTPKHTLQCNNLNVTPLVFVQDVASHSSRLHACLTASSY